jgi:crotonobetainyl-CoA:carnitine CoA-transferase CaiB-like acyl-CoA transferase
MSDEPARGPGPLAGLWLIELGTLLARPFVGRLLGDMRAEVIKIEPAGKPDPLREWGQARYEGRTLWWPVQARNKKCITLNLRESRGQELLLELVGSADAVTENFRSGTRERWNLGYEQLSEANLRIVLARKSRYGQIGPYAEREGYACVAEAMGGVRHINGFPDEPPPRIFEDPQYKAREMLVEHVDPEFGPYIGPDIVPKFSGTPGEVQWSRPWQEGSHNEEIFCGLLGLSDSELGTRMA